MDSNRISFTSRIRPCSIGEYVSEISDIYGQKSFRVSYPWTANEIIKARKSYTTDIYDCTAGGITDGKDVVMFHICPTNNLNRDFLHIEDVIKEKLDIGSRNLQGFLLGCNDRFKDSVFLMEKCKKYMEDLRIPKTVVSKTLDNPTDILYNKKKDEWLICNNMINEQIENGITNPRKLLNNTYKEVYISSKDELTM